MVFIIPLIAAAMVIGGAGTLVWYGSLSKEEQKEHDKAFISFLNQQVEQITGRIGQLNAYDDMDTTKRKLRNAGLSEDQIQRAIREAKRDADDLF